MNKIRNLLCTIFFFLLINSCSSQNKYSAIDNDSILINHFELNGSEWFMPKLNSHKDGTYKIFYDFNTSRLHLEYCVLNHKLVNEYKEYFPNGELKTLRFYRDGKIEKETSFTEK